MLKRIYKNEKNYVWGLYKSWFLVGLEECSVMSNGEIAESKNFNKTMISHKKYKPAIVIINWDNVN